MTPACCCYKVVWNKGCKAQNRLCSTGYEKGHLELKLLCRGPKFVFQIGW